MSENTRDMIRKFSKAFGRPVNTEVVQLTVTERELLGKLIFEEVVEYVTLGLGLVITHTTEQFGEVPLNPEMLDLRLHEGQPYDPIESADGLGDINVVAHFNAHWHGFDLDAVTREVHLSNMSKLDENGDPIINRCTVCSDWEDCDITTHLIDPSKPVGKILKGKYFFKPNIATVIGVK